MIANTHREYTAALLQTADLLRALVLFDSDPRFLSAVTYFISRADIKPVLYSWKNEHRLAGLLAEFPLTLLPATDDWHIIGDESLTVEKKLGGPKIRQRQYPSFLIAARTALPKDKTSIWIDRLRVYLLLKMLDSTIDGVPREDRLYQVSTVVRSVCESTTNIKHRWLDTLASDALGFVEFESDLEISGRRALRESIGWESFAGAQRFFKSIVQIAEGAPWIKLAPTGANHGDDRSFSAISGSINISAIEKVSESKHNDLQTQSMHQDADGAKVGVAVVPTGSTRFEARRHGEKVRLQDLESHLFLPWSWHRLRQEELEELGACMLASVSAPDRQAHLGAALVSVSLTTGLSLHDVVTIPFTEISSKSWWLDTDKGLLLRRAPRFSRRWRAAAHGAESDVRDIAELWQYKLPRSVVSALRACRRDAPAATSIKDIWSAVSPADDPSSWLDSLQANVRSLRSATAGVVGQTVHDATGDHVLARLIEADERADLPAASAYGAYSGNEVATALAGVVSPHMIVPDLDAEANACGSEIDGVLADIARAISELIDGLNSAAESADMVGYHNRLVTLTTLALLASTGGRPVDSPFESRASIDLDRRLVYVEDKSAGNSRGGRLCVLSDFAAALLDQVYLPHLEHLALAVAEHSHAFSAALVRTLTGGQACGLPLLFHLDGPNASLWTEVTEKSLKSFCRLSPLPANVLRHVHATWLRRYGLDHDIRDALLGHADRDAEPHGDLSPRTALRDIEAARCAVNALQLKLGLRLPMRASINAAWHDVRIEHTSRIFGRRAREHERDRRAVSAEKAAIAEIQEALNGRNLHELTAEEVDALTIRMVRRKSMPHSMASVRVQAFEDYIQRHGQTPGRQPPRRLRAWIHRPARDAFAPDAVSAAVRLRQIGEQFEDVVKHARIEGPVQSACCAAIDLILRSRWTHQRALTSVVLNRSDHWRLVRFQSRYWIEWSEGPWQDGRPCLRIAASNRAAQWLAAVLQSSRSATVSPAIPRCLERWAQTITPGASDVIALVKSLCHIQNQANVLELRGFEAAMLSERLASSDLPHRDWVRQERRVAMLPTASESLTHGPAAPLDEAAQWAMGEATATKLPASERCHKLFAAIRAILSGDGSDSGRPADDGEAVSPPGIGTSANAVHIDPVKRSESRQVAIARLPREHGFVPGDLPSLAAGYAVHLLTRPLGKPKGSDEKNSGRGPRLRTSTVLRYWDSLAGPICQAASGANLMGADEEDVTECYAAIVAAAGDKSQDSTDSADATVNTDAVDAAYRTAQELTDFHDYAARKFGIEEPDWAEVGCLVAAPSGRPATFTETEYQRTLQAVLDAPEMAQLSETSLALAVVLLIAFRFGLRLSEALGLAGRDVLAYASTTVVLVRKNSLRPLKTEASRRRVPLLETLTPSEAEVLSEALRRWKLRPGDQARDALLNVMVSADFVRMRARVSAALRRLLSDVTLSRTTVHSLRHAYATRVARYLLDERSANSAVDGTAAEHTRRLLLGRDDRGRRLFWALARLLGHSSPRVTFSSYLHLGRRAYAHDEHSANAVVGVASPTLIDLDAANVDACYLERPLRPVRTDGPTDQRPLLARQVDYLRLVGAGQQIHTAAQVALLDEAETKQTDRVLNTASERLVGEDRRYRAYKLLGGVEFGRLTALVADLKMDHTADRSVVRPWLSTVGRNRQIVIWDKPGIDALAAFLHHVRLGADDIAVVCKNEASAVAQQARPMLDAYLRPLSMMPKGFQIDVASTGAANFPDRLGVVPLNRAGAAGPSHGLLLLWILWITSHQTEDEDPRDRSRDG